MSIRYRLKRNSGPVHEPIPAHPDAIYRPQNRPIPASAPPVDSGVIAPRLLADNPMVAAPLAAGGSGFSPWWIIGPLLALLAAMAVGALAYNIKKKQNAKKQVEEENNPEKRKISNTKASPNKEETSDDDDAAKKLSNENMPLRNMKSDALLNKQKRTIPMSSTAKGSSPSNTNPSLIDGFKKQQLSKSALLAHDLLPTNNTSIVLSARPDSTSSLSHHSPFNVLKHSDAENNPILHTPLKKISSVSTHNTESNHSENLPPSSSSSANNFTTSPLPTRPKLGQSNDGLELEAGKLKSNTNLDQKRNQPNDLAKIYNDKSSSDESSTNLQRADHTKPLKAGYATLPSSHSDTNDFKKAHDDRSTFGERSTDLVRLDHSVPSTPSETNDSDTNKRRSESSLDRKGIKLNDLQKTQDDKTPFGEGSRNHGRVHHTKSGYTDEKFTLPSSRSGTNNLYGSKLKSDVNLTRKKDQSDAFKIVHDDKSTFGESSTNDGRAERNALSKAGYSSLPSSGSGTNDSNRSEQKSDYNRIKKGDQSNDIRKTHDDRTPFDQSSTNLKFIERILPSSHSELNNPNPYINQLNSPEQHGVGKSPLISDIPTGAKRSTKGKFSSKSSFSDPDLQQQQKRSTRENTHSIKSEDPSSSPSKANKDNQSSTLVIDPSTEPKNKISSNAFTSAKPINEQNDQSIHNFTKELDVNPSQSHTDSSNPQKSINSNDDKSDESNTSLTQPDLTNRNKTISFMPNVPQCKTNTSSSDDDYDEIYPIPSNKSFPKRFHSKDKL